MSNPSMVGHGEWPRAKGGALIVGITAFGLYVESPEANASNIILAALPAIIDSETAPARRIHLLKYPEIYVTYDAVARAVDDIWSPQSTVWSERAATAGIEYDHVQGQASATCGIDFMIHLGQMRSYPGYSFERLANRDQYERKDLSGNTPDTLQTQDGQAVEERFAGCPSVLQPDLDVQELTAAVQQLLPDVQLRASTDAGRFVCEYIFYSSMALLYKRGVDKRVMFMHVPPKYSAKDVATGVQVLTSLIRTIATKYV